MKSQLVTIASGRYLRGVALGTLAVLIGAIIAAVVLIDNGRSHDNGLGVVSGTKYENREHGYQIEYSPDWVLKEESTTCDDMFCVQSIELKRRDEASVFVFVNFQGGWCESSPRPLVKDIVVSGYHGKEYYCQDFTIRSFGPGDSIIRYFTGVQGKINYLILGQAHTDFSEVEAVIETFEFVD